MTKAADAKVGDKEECNICHVMLTCGLTEPSVRYSQKNQWQLNGESHYIFKPNQEMTCKGIVIEDPKNKPEKSSPTEPYIPKTLISPEVMRTESFIDFSKVYNEAIPKAKEIAEQLFFGVEHTATETFPVTQRILRDYINFYIAQNL